MNNTDREQVMESLRKQGFRITNQRKILIDIILSENCSCCKEVYVLASKKDPGIGIATVYRTVDALEKAGALKRGAAYEICRENRQSEHCCLVELEDHSTVKLDHATVQSMIEQGMQKSGLLKGKKIKGITLMQADEFM